MVYSRVNFMFPLSNYWTIWSIFTKFCTNVMLLETTYNQKLYCYRAPPISVVSNGARPQSFDNCCGQDVSWTPSSRWLWLRSIAGMTVDEKTKVSREEPVLESFVPSHILHTISWAWTLAFTMRTRASRQYEWRRHEEGRLLPDAAYRTADGVEWVLSFMTLLPFLHALRIWMFN
jgi:hypothetical protein